MRSLLWGCCALLLAGSPAAALAGGPPEWVQDSRQAARELGSRLMAELTSAMADSPVAAIRVCRERAPLIAAEVSATTGRTVRRTALRWRNPDNAPTTWQRRALESFDTALREGADPASLEYTEVAAVEGSSEQRWMKPIVTAPVCLACHGSHIDPAVAGAIHEFYPDDRATGFVASELRGAFVVTSLRPTAPAATAARDRP